MALEITQVKSTNGSKANQLATMQSLGLRKIRQVVVLPDRPEIRGMVDTVSHLVTVREVADEAPKKSKKASSEETPAAPEGKTS